MLVRLNLYKFYLRITLYTVPLLAFIAAFYLRASGAFGAWRSVDFPDYAHLLLFISLIWSIVIERYQLTSVSRLFQENSGAFAALTATAVTYTVTVTALFLAGHFEVSRMIVGISALATVLFTVVARALFRIGTLASKRRQQPRRILVVGTDKFARRAAWRLAHGPFSSARIIGYVRLPGQQVLVRNANVRELDSITDQALGHDCDEVIIAVSPAHFSILPQVTRVMETLCIPVRAVVDLDGVIIRDKLFQFGHMQIINVASTPAECLSYLLLKRVFDIAFSVIAIAVTAPFMAVIAIGIRLTSPGPILFKQDRVGLNGAIFRMLKFRTMRVSNSISSDVTWTTENDPRRTRFGTFLRNCSLDELPQFFNVLRGEMSVVGPRPERPHFVRKFQQEYVEYNRRHHLKVGITGWAQVNGLRGDTSIRKRVQYDLYYLQNWSFWLDLRIVFRTIASGLVNKNAY